MHASSSSSASLTGLRVVELGREIAAAYCTKLLADLGADVTIVEPASGHALRAHGPVPSEDADRGGALFQYLAAGKRSVALDLTIDAARRDLVALASCAEVLVEDLGPDELERITVSDGVATRAGGPLAVVSISPFGRSGPYAQLPATSLVVQAAGGWAARIGTPEGPPFHVGGHMEQYVGGAFAAAAALTALRHARRTGERADVDVSLMECMAGTIPYPMLQKITFDRLGFPVPQRYQPIPGILACADGHVAISALTGQHWADVCTLIGVPELAEKMREVALRGAEWEAFLARAQPWLAARASVEIVDLFQAIRVPAVPIGDGANLPDLEPFRSRGFYVE